MKGMLRTGQNTEAMGLDVRDAACIALGFKIEDVQTDFEHCQWWVTHKPTGAQWGAEDAEGPGSVDDFSFEQVTPGDDEDV